MPIVLYRIDERLIHGQVFLGWRNYLEAEKLVILNEQVASDPQRKKIYLDSVTDEVKAVVFSVAEGAKKISQGEFEKERTIVLFDSPRDLLRLVQAGVKITEANLGGMYFKQGRREILPYIYLTKEEIATFKELLNLGIKVFCQEVPGAEKKDLKVLLQNLSFGYTMS